MTILHGNIQFSACVIIFTNGMRLKAYIWCSKKMQTFNFVLEMGNSKFY